MKQCFSRCLRPIMITVLAILTVLIVGIHLIPFFIDANDYKDLACSEFEKSTGMELRIDSLKLSMSPLFKAQIEVGEAEVLSGSKKVFRAKKINLGIPLLPMISKKIQIKDVYMLSPRAYLVKNKQGSLLIEKSFDSSSRPKPITPPKKGFIADVRGLSLGAEDYKLNYVDKSMPVELNVQVVGKGLKVQNLDPYGKTYLGIDGSLIINNNENLTYKIKTHVNLAPFQKKNIGAENSASGAGVKVSKKMDWNPLYQIYKNNITANLLVDMNINDFDNMQGELLIDKLSMKSRNGQLPESRLFLKARRDKFYTDSKIFVNKGAYLNVCGDLEQKSLKLKVKSSLIKLADVKSLAASALALSGAFPYELNKTNVDGDIIANLNIESDFNTLKSSGYLKLNNAGLEYRGLKPSVTAFNANIKLHDNNIVFEDTSGFIDGNRFEVIGGIDAGANADVSVEVPNLNIGKLMEGLQTSQLLIGVGDKLKTVSTRGDVCLKLLFNGKLQELKPSVIILLKDLYVKQKNFALPIKITNGKVNLKNGTIVLDMPDFRLNNSKLSLSGSIPTSLSHVDVKAFGSIHSSDLSKMMNTGSIGRGKVPVLLNIWGEPTNINLLAQILNTKSNYAFVGDIGSNSIINAQVKINGSKLKLEDVSIGKTSNSELISDYSINNRGAEKIASVVGAIVDLNSRAKFQNVRIEAKKPVKLSLPIGKNASADMQGEFWVAGYLDKPKMEGSMSISDLVAPSLKTKVRIIKFNLKDKKVDIHVPNIRIGKSILSASANVDVNELEPVYVSRLNVNSEYCDADELFKLLAKLNSTAAKKPSSAKPIRYSLKKNYVPNVSPVVVKNGKFYAKTFIINNVTCKELRTDFDFDRYSLLSAENLCAQAMDGDIKGSLSHDVSFEKTGVKIKANNVDVNEFAVKFLGIPPGQIRGQGFATADIEFIGGSEDDILRSMQGGASFEVHHGEMGNLGRIDHYLRAANILSNNILSVNLNRIIGGVSLHDTGKFTKANGKLSFIKGGILRIEHLKTQGPKLSIYIRGDLNNINSFGSLDVYGRLSHEVVKVLGPLGEFSMDKLIKKVPLLAELSKYGVGLLETAVPENQRNQIPPLSSSNLQSQEFSAKIRGSVYKASSVKSFRWIKAPDSEQNIKPKAAPISQSSSDQLKTDVEKLLENPQQIFSIFAD